MEESIPVQHDFEVRAIYLTGIILIAHLLFRLLPFPFAHSVFNAGLGHLFNLEAWRAISDLHPAWVRV